MRRRALITGASAGLGAALARVFAARDWDLVITARRGDRLATLAAELEAHHGTRVDTVPLDLATPDAPERLIEAALRNGLIDGLVNNAGYNHLSRFIDTRTADHAAMLAVMLTTPVALTHAVLPAMAERRFGRILNVASLAGLLPATGGETLYGPTKAFMIKASRGLNAQMRGSGVHVTALAPGFVRTEFHDANGARGAVEAAYPRWMWMDAQAVAQAGFDAVEANRPLWVPGLANRALAAVGRALPEGLMMRLIGRHEGRLERPPPV